MKSVICILGRTIKLLLITVFGAVAALVAAFFLYIPMAILSAWFLPRHVYDGPMALLLFIRDVLLLFMVAKFLRTHFAMPAQNSTEFRCFMLGVVLGAAYASQIALVGIVS